MIVDDEPLALDVVEHYVRKTPFLELTGRCSSALEAIALLETQPVDLLFLDIQMPDLDGVAFSRTLKNGPKVIFTTAFEQYALEGFKVDALDYLLKPFNYEEFLKAANKAREWFQMAAAQQESEKKADHLFVKSEYKLIRIDLAEVLYFEGWKDYIKIHLEGQAKPILTLMSLKALEEKLPSDQFMRVHRSYIVNLLKIKLVERSRIVVGDFAIVVAEQYREKFQQYLSNKFLNP